MRSPGSLTGAHGGRTKSLTPNLVLAGAKLGELQGDPAPAVESIEELNGKPTVRITTRPVAPRERRVMFRLLCPEFDAGEIQPICRDANDKWTIRSAFAARLCRPLGELDLTVLSELDSFADRFLEDFVSPVETEPDFEEALAETSYNQSRKDQMRELYSRLAGAPPPLHHRQQVNAFVKVESYQGAKQARMICSRSDWFKAWSLRWFRAIERQVYGLKWFVKHVPVPERPRLVAEMKLAGMKYVWTDFTAFESSFRPEIMRAVECKLYRWVLRKYPHIADVICNTISGTNRIRTRRGVHVVVDGRRMSGDMCTSLGNGFSNLVVTLLSLVRDGNAYEDVVQYPALFEGDDGLYAAPRNPGNSTPEGLGFTIKMTEVEDPCYAGFCGIVAADGQNLRDPYKFIQTFGWTSSAVDGRQSLMMQLLRAKSLSAVYETPQCPIVGAIARRGLTLTRGYTPRWVEDGYHQQAAVPRDEGALPEFTPSEEVRAVFARLFGISPADQVAWEHKITAGAGLGSIYQLFAQNGTAASMALMRRDRVGGGWA